MPISGKYNFPGIKKIGSAGLRVALSSSPKTAWLLRFSALTDLVLEFIANWLANKGLLILNLGAVYIEGEFDQKKFDHAMDQAIREIQLKGGREKLTAQEIKDIDDKVIKAARGFIVIGNPK